jgi:ADP-ribose pyrophosphatase YjhB (NUDIX family)
LDYLSALRKNIGTALIPLVYSTVFISDESGRILFQHRPDFNRWGLPGGILEIGESPAECARREAFEETGLRVNPIRLTAVLSSPKHNILYPNGDKVQQVSFFFESRILGGSLRPEKGESTRLDFFAPENFPATLPWYELALTKRTGDNPFFDPPEFAASAGENTPKPAEDDDWAQGSTWAFIRKRMGPAPLILPGATALIHDARGRILLARRIDTGRWGLPGGLLELGESLAGTAIRETEEETGLRIEPLRVRGIFGGQRVVFPGGDTLYPVSTWFDCEIRSGSPRPDTHEIDRTEFFETTNLPEMIPGVRNRLDEVLASPSIVVFH